MYSIKNNEDVLLERVDTRQAALGRHEHSRHPAVRLQLAGPRTAQALRDTGVKEQVLVLSLVHCQQTQKQVLIPPFEQNLPMYCRIVDDLHTLRTAVSFSARSRGD